MHPFPPGPFEKLSVGSLFVADGTLGHHTVYEKVDELHAAVFGVLTPTKDRKVELCDEEFLTESRFSPDDEVVPIPPEWARPLTAVEARV